jgi:hypothetical protein
VSSSFHHASDFVLIDLEGMTHKAGNVKKMGAFVKMLALAFSKSNEKVKVDVLTFTDLALKKAQSMGANMPTSASSEQNSTRYQKRYVIMTYRGDFDSKDVHYPLTLEFEEKPNFPALKRVIARLRKQIAELESQEHEPSSEKERFASAVSVLVLERRQTVLF